MKIDTTAEATSPIGLDYDMLRAALVAAQAATPTVRTQRMGRADRRQAALHSFTREGLMRVFCGSSHGKEGFNLRGSSFGDMAILGGTSSGRAILPKANNTAWEGAYA